MCGSEKKTSKIMSAALSVLIAVMIFSVSMAVPFLCRPFYYAQIQPLKLTEASGMTEGQIRQTYDEMIAFCLGKADDFSLSLLSWSKRGADHFADVRALVLWDIRLAVISCILCLAVVVLSKLGRIKLYRFCGHGPGFWAAIGFCGILAVVGILSALDFERAFTVFHSVLFPGKDNWLFDEAVDPVICILPQKFFQSCAALIAGVAVLWCVALVLADLQVYNRNRRNEGKNVY